MAKGLRASTKKANRVKLRSKVFGPVEDARTQRLSAKLLELASKPKDEDVRMEEDAATVGLKQREKEAESDPIAEQPEEGMDTSDNNPAIARKRHTPRSHTLKKRRGKATAIWIFTAGFFPYKPFLPGRAQYHGDVDDFVSNSPFNKVIFMVVDALRSDFVYSTESGFHFTQSLIRSGAAIPFTAHATAPTITMPRVKAITTGSIPSFLDVILNFAESDTSSTLAMQDTWPFQLKAKPGGRLVMYGDDTWLKLFPDTFFRSDGTTSFFVSDFTEVDQNVTRHVPFELDQGDWNGMIMHYLGLDHIGHKSGPQSPHMIPKHHEMDSIVEQIYQALQTKDHLKSTLLVLCGDHGMNDAGNHGGSAPGETSPALVFMSPKLESISLGTPCPPESPNKAFQYYNVVEQSDVAPTLAGLLGFPIPLNNLGIFIPDFLRFWSKAESVVLMTRNAQQVLHIVQATFSDIDFHGMVDWTRCTKPASDVEQLQCLWAAVKALQDNENASAEEQLSVLTKFLRAAQDIMSSTASNYGILQLQLGIATAAVTTCCAVAALAALTPTGWCFWTSALLLNYGGMMFASSYVEEEQYFWYWIASGWLIILYLKFISLSTTFAFYRIVYFPVLFTIHRVLRRWNQTGQKHAGEPDIAKTFLAAHNILLWTAVTVTFLDISRRLAWFGLPGAPTRVASCASIILCLSAFGFKVAFTIADAPELLTGTPQYLWKTFEGTSLVTLARIVLWGLALSVGYNMYQSIKQKPDFKTSAKGKCSDM
ncbi:major facilitator super transporter protein [Xylographa pallens]|nr:major facilitator super transporter protein [Xylographa pallens]